VIETHQFRIRSWGMEPPPKPVLSVTGPSYDTLSLTQDSEVGGITGTIQAASADGQGDDLLTEDVKSIWKTATLNSGVMSSQAAPVGRYGYRMVITTYMRSDGQESGASDPSQILCTETHDTLTVSITASSDPDVTGIKVYVSNPGGDQTYLAATLENTTATYNHNLSEPLQNYMPLMTDALQQPPAGQLIEYYNTKIYVAKEDYVMSTLGSSYELMPMTDYFYSPSGSITMLKAVDTGLWVASAHEIWYFDGDTMPFKAVKKADYGVIFRSAAKKNGLLLGDSPATHIIAQTPKGFVRLGNGGEITPLTERVYRPESPSVAASCITDDRGFLRYINAYSLAGAQSAQGTYN
jgi:hypothetical protein